MMDISIVRPIPSGAGFTPDTASGTLWAEELPLEAAFLPAAAEAWSVSGTLTADLHGADSQITFRCVCDEENSAEFLLLRDSADTCGLRKNITRSGTRLQTSGRERVFNSVQSCAGWTAAFHLLFHRGFVYLFLQEPGKTMCLATSYGVDWAASEPRFEVTGNARVTFSRLAVSRDAAAVRDLYESLAVTGKVKNKTGVLFLGNSCIFFYDTPNTFSRLARQAGYQAEADAIAQSSAYLSQFDDPETYIGGLAAKRLQKPWDLVILQDNSNILRTPERTEAARAAVESLAAKIRESGSEPMLYVRPPRNNYGDTSDPVQAARQLDEFYTPLGEKLKARCCYENRAFGLAYRDTGINLWHTDNAHQNEKGAYLTACVLFATLFGTSCQVLGDDSLPAEEAKALRTVADRVVLNGEIPWA